MRKVICWKNEKGWKEKEREKIKERGGGKVERRKE